jgi:hypothetical protein
MRAAAVVEFNALADSIWTGPENHDLAAIARFGLALVFIARIEVWRE